MASFFARDQYRQSCEFTHSDYCQPAEHMLTPTESRSPAPVPGSCGWAGRR